MNIRDAEAGDVPAITEIYARSVVEETASFEHEPPVETEMLSRMESLLDAGYPYLVAAENDGVLGYAYAGPYRPRPAYRHTVENTVYVAKEAQRRGVGKALMLKLIDRCCESGFRQMIGVIGGAHHQASIALHETLGFEKAGQLKQVGHKHGRWLDVVLMQRQL